MRRIGFALTFVVLPALLLSLAACSQEQLTEPAVKKSRQGICHERGTVSYIQTIYFDSFPSMDACLRSGGRLANSRSATVPEDRSIRWWMRVSKADAERTILVVAVIAVAGWLGRCRYLKWKQRRKLRQFEAEQRRRWAGHKRE